MDVVMAKVLQHTNSKRLGRRTSLVFTKDDFELSSSPFAPAASSLPINQSTVYLRYTSENDMCIQLEGLLMTNGRLLCAEKDVKAIGIGFSPSTCWRISRAPRHAIYLQDTQQRYLCSEPDGHVFLGTPGPSIGWGQELWTINDNFLVNAYGKYLSVDLLGGLSCVDSKSDTKIMPAGGEVLEGYVYKCGLLRGNNPILLYFVLNQHGLSTYISKEAYLMARHVQVAPSLPFSGIESAHLDNNTCCIRLQIKTEDLSLQHLMCRSPYEATIWLRALNRQPIVSGSSHLSSILALWASKSTESAGSLSSGTLAGNPAVLAQSSAVPAILAPAILGSPALLVQNPPTGPSLLTQSPLLPPAATPPRHPYHGLLPPPPPCRSNGSMHPPGQTNLYSQSEAHVKPTSPSCPQRSCTFSTPDPPRRSSLSLTEGALASLSPVDIPSRESSSSRLEAAGSSSGRGRASPGGPQDSKSMIYTSSPADLAAFNMPTRARRASLAVPPPPPFMGIVSHGSSSAPSRIVNDTVHSSAASATSLPPHAEAATINNSSSPALPPASPPSSTSEHSDSSGTRSSSSCSYLYSSMSSMGVPSASSSQLFASPPTHVRSIPSSPETVSIHENHGNPRQSIGSELAVWLPPSQHSVPLRAVPTTEEELKEFIRTLHLESVTLRSVMASKQKKLQSLIAEKEAKVAALHQLGPKATVVLQRERQMRYCANEELAMKIVHLKKQLRTMLHGFEVEDDVSLTDSEADA